MNVDAILFDFGDTLVLVDGFDHNACLKSLHESLTESGIHVPFKEFRQKYFEARDQLYEETRGSLREPHFHLRVSRALQKFGYNYLPHDPLIAKASLRFNNTFLQYMRIEENTLRILNHLHKRYRLGVVSNMALPAAVTHALKKFGLAPYFEVVVISGEVGWRKPSPRIFQHALNQLKIDAPQVAFVGDSLDTDIQGAKQIGMKTIWVKRKTANERLVEEIRPDRVVHGLDEILQVLRDC